MTDYSKELFGKKKTGEDYAAELFPKQKPVSVEQPKLSSNIIDNIAGSISEPLLKMGTGMLAKPISEVAGLAATGYEAATGGQNAGLPSQFAQDIQSKLTYEPRTVAGASKYNPLNFIPEGIGKVISGGANIAADAVSGGQDPSSLRGMAGNALREALPQSLAFMGAKQLPKVPANIAAKQAALDLIKKQQQPFRDVVSRSRDQGLVMPPGSVNPSITNRAIESLSGKAATQYDVSLKNQPQFNKIGQRSLGITDDVPLTPDVFDAVRSKAGKVYEDLKTVGDFPSDAKFTSAINNIKLKTKSQGNFATLKNPAINDLVTDLQKKNFASADAVALMQKLRADATGNLGPLAKPLEKNLGHAQKAAAKALEELVDRQLVVAEKFSPGMGYGELAQNFVEARKTIAKSYSLQKATDLTGNVDPRILASQLKAGKPLSGELKTLAEFGSTFPKASINMQKAGSASSATTPLVSTLLAATGYGTLGPGGIALAALPAVRPLARAGMLSPQGQRMLTSPPSYDVGALSRLMAGGKPVAGIAAPYLADEEDRKKRGLLR